MRSLLFIAYLYPPIADSGTRRSLEFANHLPNHGWQPTVLTCAAPKPRDCDERLLDEVRPGTRVLRAEPANLRWARRLSALAPSSQRERVAQGLAWRMENLWPTVPDGVAVWRSGAVAAALKAHRETPFDAILATGWPWTSFLVAQDVARLTGLPYVLDYRDQWTPSGDMPWEQSTPERLRANPMLERLAAKDAAAIITVTQALVASVGRDCGRDDLHLITNGYEPSDFTVDAQPLADGLLRVAYTGVWRPGYGLYDLYAAIALLKAQGHPELARLRVQAAGFTPGPATEAGVAEWVSELGPVPHGRAVALMKQADLLYLPVPRGYYATASLPGKLFEYLASGRPILAVVPEASEVAWVLAGTGGGLRVEPGDVAGLAALLLAWLRGQVGVEPPSGIERYTRAATTQRLARVLDAAADGRRLEPLR